jgi:hypothetical protein
MSNGMVVREGFFLRTDASEIATKKINMAHRFELLRAPINIALPIAPHLAAPPALPWQRLVLVLRTCVLVLVLLDRPLLVQPQMGSKALLSRKRPARTLVVRAHWGVRRADMLL